MKTKFLILITLAFIGLSNLYAQVGIGTETPDPSAKLDITASDKGVLPPRLTTAERDNISNPAEGLAIYNTDNDRLESWNGSRWTGPSQSNIEFTSTTVSISGPCAGALDEFKFKGLTYKTLEANGECFLDRNLGAQAATSTPRSDYASDAAYINAEEDSFGDYYQWGRSADGHEKKTSQVIDGEVAANLPPDAQASGVWDGKFIERSTQAANWFSGFNENLWLGVDGLNNPCPAGYRLPTQAEFENIGFTDLNSTFNILKLPIPGIRRPENNPTPPNIIVEGDSARYWEVEAGFPTPSNSNKKIPGNLNLNFTPPSGFTEVNPDNNAAKPSVGSSVRCILDQSNKHESFRLRSKVYI